MAHKTANGRLSRRLTHKIDSLEASAPYVWRLHLTEAEFHEIEHCLSCCVEEHGGCQSCLLTEEWARVVMVYTAEWYKRRYASGNSQEMFGFSNKEMEQLWDMSGWNKRVFVYTDAAGNKRWLYSIYVLGGLAVRHELGRGDKGRFLKALCRIYHGEELKLDNFDEDARAVSFRESISRKHSLYHFIKEILSGDMPFAEEEVRDTTGDVSRFVEAVRRANDEVMRQKFRMEWIVTNHPGHDTMSRRLRLWLKPEELGGGLHQYLRYDRMHLWGIPNPERQATLRIALCFLMGDEVALAADFTHGLIVYNNTGDPYTGFLSWGVTRYATCKNVPTARFDRIVIQAQTADGHVYDLQEQTTTDYMQLWRTDSLSNEWSSTPHAQHETALVFSSRCHLEVTESMQNQIHSKPFVQGEEESERFGWFHIYDNVVLADEKGVRHTFYNRNGYDQITTRLYTDTISYIDGGYIRHFYVDDPDQSDEPGEELLPLIFSKDDVVARHFVTKDGAKVDDSEENVAEQIEWKQANGHYAVWNDTDTPPYGVAQLRISIKGVYRPLRVAYLAGPVARNVGCHTISYKDLQGGEAVDAEYKDNIALDGTPLHPTASIRIGGKEGFVLDVYRPIDIREVVMDGRVVSYCTAAQCALPYILKYEATYRDFGSHGFRSYCCQQMDNIYTHLGEIYPDLGEIKDLHIKAWKEGTTVSAQMLDPYAPESLLVCFGTPKGAGADGQDILKWNYIDEPEAADYADEPAKHSLICQSMRVVNNDLALLPPKMNHPPFGANAVLEQVDMVRCFETAVTHRLHFFTLFPFTVLEKENKEEAFIKQVIEKIVEQRGGSLTGSDMLGLRRMAEEFKLNWNAIERVINQNSKR